MVKCSNIDPASVVYSYTEDPYFKDCFYWGEIKTIPMSELVKIDPDITNEDMEEISKYSQSWYNYYNNSQYYENSLFYKDTCTLLYFNYKTTHSFVYKKKKMPDGSFKTVEKDDQFNPPQEMMDEGNFERVEKRIEVWYDGIMVMGTNILLKWELAENMVRPKSASQHTLPNYVACAPRMYKGTFESLVRRMIPFADLIQISHLKIQQVISRMVPDGVFIDADGLNEVDLGTGNAYNPEDALRLYFQTGSVVGRSFTQDGEFNNARVPITQLTGNTGTGKMQMLIQNYNHYLDMIRTVTGLNEARDGSTPNPDALVGVQKLAALNSNTATRHILNASLFMTQRMAEGIMLRTADVLQYSDFKDQFAMQIGKYNLNLLDDIKNLYLYDFGIFLKLKRKQKATTEQQAAMQQQAAQAEAQQAAIMAQSQAEMQKQQMMLQNAMQLKQAEVAMEIEKMNNQAQLKSVLMEKEFAFNMQLKGIEQSQIDQREQSKEQGKADRITMANSQQSKMIEQRKRNLPPIQFESNEDSLDGFDFAEFNPR